MNKVKRKFLVSADIERWLKEQTFSIKMIERFYVESDSDIEWYYMKSFPRTYMKVMTSMEEKENIMPVTEETYVSKSKNAIGNKIVKETYTVTLNKETLIVSKYLKQLEGLYIIDAYFEDEKAMRNSNTIQSLQPFILKEIDRDEKYSDKSLSLYEKPMEYNLEQLFKNIDAFEPANLFFWQVPGRIYVRDGLGLILYRNLRLLHHYKFSYQHKHMSATLHRLRVILRRTATMLETFSDLFTPNVQRLCTNLMLRYYEDTKFLRYLYFLEELASTREDAKLRLYSELKSLIFQEETVVTQMLLSKPFVQMIQMLTREVHEQGHQQFKPLKNEAKKAVKEQLKLFEMQLEKTREGYDDDMLEQLYASMDSLQTLLEDFFHIIGEKETLNIVDELNILLKPLREYRNCKERVGILRYVKECSGNGTLDIDPLLCKHSDALEDKIENALKLLRSSKFYI